MLRRATAADGPEIALLFRRSYGSGNAEREPDALYERRP